MKSNTLPDLTALLPFQSESGIRRTKARLGTLPLLVVAGGSFLAVNGCASTNETAGKGEQALVCPQCKMVAVTVNRPYISGSGPGAYLGGRKQTVDRDTCPGCQGAITTFFKEGKLTHKCSVCKESPFTCPVLHPTNS